MDKEIPPPVNPVFSFFSPMASVFIIKRSQSIFSPHGWSLRLERGRLLLPREKIPFRVAIYGQTGAGQPLFGGPAELVEKRKTAR